MKIEGRRALKGQPVSENTIESLIVDSAAAARPPERLTVAQSAEKYRKLNNPGSYVGPWINDTTPYLVEPMNELQSLSYDGMIFAGPAQCGKALALDTPLPTPSGWTTIGSICPGDFVFGSNGAPVRVEAVSEIMKGRDCFRVTFDDGIEIVADAEHVWLVSDRRSENEKTLNTQTMRDLGVHFRNGKRSRFRIKNGKELQMPAVDLEVHPYVMGVWLGDGSRSSGYISVDESDLDVLCVKLESLGCSVSVYRDPNSSRCPSIRVTLPDGRLLASVVRGREKVIPLEYMRASPEQRRDILRGLMDTDGTSGTARRVEFYQTKKELAQQVFELAASLGMKPRITTKLPPKETHYNVSYRVSFTPENPSDVFSMKRKILAAMSGKKPRPSQVKERSIVSIEPVPSVSVRCIKVSSADHLFLAGEGMVPTHNTDMAMNWIGYSAICDPADMMVIQTSNVTARDFSMRRIDRLHRHSPEIGRKLVPGKGSDNTFDKHYRSGMLLTLSWPTINELSGKPIPRLWLTDYDRMPEDVDGEGNAFDLARKRATTFRRYAMCAAESSPGYAVENPKWIRKTRHEAPPTRGILALYNRGDRRRWYWQCVECRNSFEPSFELLEWPDSEDIMEAAEGVTLVCPHCNHRYHHDPGHGPGKNEMNRGGRWVKDGQLWTPEGLIVGTPSRSTIASFWLKGVAAAFSDWKTLVHRYLTATAEYDNTGSEEALKATVNTDQGEAYTPKSMANDRVPEVIKGRARNLGDRVVPDGVRFMIASIDVQKNRFVVQVHGVSYNGDIYVIDRFDIRHSKRPDPEREDQVLWVNPGAYPEDWKLVAEQVVQKSYPLGDGSGRQMAIRYTVCDSGGREGVTANAYDFVRWLRKGDPLDEDGKPLPLDEQGTYEWQQGMHGRFMLLKGASTKTAPRTKIDYPDSQRKDRNAGARGEIPVLFINTNLVKDMVDHRLDRTDPGGRFVFPDWLGDNFYTELTVEIKDPRKGWINPRNYRNESWDLLAYCMAATLTPTINLERLDLVGEPPLWAAEWDDNDLVFDPVVVDKPFDTERKNRRSLKDLAGSLA